MVESASGRVPPPLMTDKRSAPNRGLMKNSLSPKIKPSSSPSLVEGVEIAEWKMVDRLVNSEANARRIAIVESCFGSSGLRTLGRVLVGDGVLTKCRRKPNDRQFFLLTTSSSMGIL